MPVESNTSPVVDGTGSRGAGEVAFSVKNLQKRYGEIEALRGVTLQGRYGEVVGLVGDNGAGKSTFCKLLSGAEAPSGGSVTIGGQGIHVFNPRVAARAGVGTVYQNIPLALHVSIADNLFMGSELVKRPRPLGIRRMDRRTMEEQATSALDAVGVHVDAHRLARALSGGQRQAVAVARMILFSRSVVLMDEPTAALSAENRARVDRAIRGLVERGAAVLVVGHNLPEVLEVADRVVVFRLGRVVADLRASEASVQQLLELMSGVSELAPQ